MYPHAPCSSSVAANVVKPGKSTSVSFLCRSGWSRSLLGGVFSVLLAASFQAHAVEADDFSNYYPIPLTPADDAGAQAQATMPLSVDSEKLVYSDVPVESDVETHQLSSIASAQDSVLSGSDLPLDAFGIFQREMDLFRLAEISGKSLLNLEILAKSQPENNLLSQSDLYQELLFHTSLGGIRQYTFNNANATADDELLLGQSLLELDQLLGVNAYQSSLDALIDWQGDYVLSSAEQGDGTIWRFSPRLQGDETLDDVVLANQPAQFAVGATKLTLPKAEVLAQEEAISSAGVWAITNHNIAAASCETPTTGKRCVEYFANTTLEGMPRAYLESKTSLPDDLTEAQTLYAQNWGLLGTGFGAGINGFAVRMTETQTLLAGEYEFSVKADDGVRLWLGDELLIDAWSEQESETRTLTKKVTIESGEQTLALEYADYAAEAGVSLSLQQLSCTDEQCANLVEEETEEDVPATVDEPAEEAPAEEAATEEELEEKEAEALGPCGVLPENAYCALFYDGIELAGEPILMRTDEHIDFYWKDQSPEEGVVPKDRFSVRWLGMFDFDAGTYRFISATDDGIRIWVDGEEIISSWKLQGTTEYFADVELTDGQHEIKVEYYENYGWATAKLRWEKASSCSGIPENQFCGSFFNQDKAFEGEPDRTYLTDSINHIQETNQSPLHGIRHYKYSVRWEGQFDFPQDGFYQFNSDADDGLRIWVDDELVTDTWKRPWPFYGKDQRVVPITAGSHVVKVEYYQRWGAAKADVNWEYVEECSGEIKDAFCMEIYEDRRLPELEGIKALPKVLQKVDGIDNDWQGNAPHEMIHKDNFSVRWTGQHEFAEGTYRFRTSSDDGVRLYVDDKLIIDRWRYQSAKAYDAIVDLTEGYHTIRMEYFEGWGSAVAKLEWEKMRSCDEAQPGQVCGTFYNSNDLTGSIADIMVADTIDYDWGREAPSSSVNKDRFSVRWESTDEFAAGLYRFTTDIDDGTRIYVDGELVLDLWKRKWPLYGKRSVVVPMDAGEHTIKVEYFENWGTAKAKVNWEQVPDCSVVPEDSFCTEYYATKDLSGERIDTQLHDKLAFDWGSDKPLEGIWKDNFSTRSVGKFSFEDDYYQFDVAVDDGMKVWLDDELIIDNWKRNWYWKGKESRVVRVPAGEHTIKVEAYERYGAANASLTWKRVEGCTTLPENAYCMELYNGRALDNDGTELPKFMTQVEDIDEEWGYAAANADYVGRDNFSARWVGKHAFEAGQYRISAKTDDGVRVWIGDELVIDHWKYRNITHEAIVTLEAGLHDVKMEYYEAGGNAYAQLGWEKMLSCADVPAGQLCAEYFNNTELEGTPVDIKYVDAIDFNWEKNAPTDNVNKDKFSVRWSGDIEFEEGLYRFRTEDVDDGMRIMVDDETVLDLWKRKWPWYGNQRALKTMTAGTHNVVVEYRDDWSTAVAKAFWEKAPDCSQDVPVGEFCASYYDGKALEEGTLLDTQLEQSIDHVWGSDYPAQNVPRDQFSVRWIGDFEFAEGEYTFNITTDDGFRLKVADETLIDSWKNQAPTPYQKRTFLEAGTHRVVAEYYENWGGATAQLSWEADQVGKPATPANLLMTANSQDQVTLTWDAQELVAGYQVYRDSELLATVQEPTYTDENVEVTKTYAYAVKALWPNQRESDAASLSVTVADTSPPAQPSGLAVISATDTSILLGWELAEDNVGTVMYEVWRDQEKVTEVTEPSYEDTGLNSFARFTYQLVAVDATGNRSVLSDPLTVFTQDGTPPSAPLNLTGTVVDNNIELRWQASTDNIGVARYQILRNDEVIGTSSNTSYQDSEVDENVDYTYTIVALDGVGNTSAPSDELTIRSGDVTAPNAVELRAEAETDGVMLSWDEAVDNTRVENYRVVRDGRVIALTKLTTYKDGSAEKGITYRYSVRAIDGSGNISLPSNEVEAGVGELCSATIEHFTNNVEYSLANCMTCHTSSGLAQNTRLIFSQASDASAQNLSAINSVTRILGGNAILNKVSGQQAHGGGTVFPQGSDEYAQLAELLTQLEDPSSCDDSGNDDAGEDDTSSEENHIPVASLVANCASCHGTEGASSGPATPGIAGLSKDYLTEVLLNYQSGKRASTVMQRIATGYTEAQIQDIASYFAAQPHHTEAQQVDAELAAQGQVIHQEYCSSCHSNGGRDLAGTGTRLAGQWKPYMQRTLQEYLAGMSEAPASMQARLDAMYQAEGDAGVEALVEFYASGTPDVEPPTQPEDLDAVTTTMDSITLVWFDPDDDWSISHYEIYRDGVLIGRSEFSVFTDTGLMPGDYEYHVIAVDSAGNRSLASDVFTASISSDDTASEGLTLLDYQATLRKASLVMLGRLPTDEESANAETEEDFRSTFRNMLDAEQALDGFVYRAAHETFLTTGAARAGAGNGIRPEDFPALDGDAGILTDDERKLVNNAIKEEPVYLLQHIVDQDRPWTESLTADYTVLHAPLAKALGAEPLSGSFDDPLNTEMKLPARIQQLSARLGDKAFPHAGVLTTNAWLSRFPTTDTNRNRHRAAKVFKQFLGVDLEALAERPIDDSGNGDYLVPTMENENCMVCHTVMDPVAGAFKNWGTSNRYQQNFNGERGDLDSLARSYKSGSYPMDHNNQPWYHGGDVWYRDMFKPGHGDDEMPGAYNNFGEANWDISANLLTNAGAEEGITGWEVTAGSLEAVNQDTCERSREPLRGDMFKLGACLEELDETLAAQTVSVASSASAIDAGEAYVNFGAYVRTLHGRDRPSVYVEFLAANGEVLGTSEAITHMRTWRWENLAHEQAIPANTRSLKLVMHGQRSTNRYVDPYIDAFVDDLYLKLKKPSTQVVDYAGAEDSLQWLGKALVRDPRFAKGTVYFWYRALFKREPLVAPLDSSAVDYADRLAAFNEQDAIFDQLAERLRLNRGNGNWNVKDLLIDMVTSPLFRANTKSASAIQTSDVGLTRLLTPEELNHKLEAVTGYNWRNFQDNRVWRDGMGIFYGGFDGGNLQTDPNTKMNTLMSRIPERMAIEMSCNIVHDEFTKGSDERTLFRYVETTDTPAFEQIDIAQNNLLTNPGAENDMQGWILETGSARILSGPRGCAGGPSIHAGEKIFNPGSICENQTELGRIYQQVDMTPWANMIDGGGVQSLFGAALRGWSRDNDEASVYLTFHAADGTETGRSESLIGGWEWKSIYDYVDIPAATRMVRFHIQGRRVNQSHPNNDSFADDAYLRVILPGTKAETLGEQHIRANIQFLHKHMLGESLAIDSVEVDRTYRLFKEVWANHTANTHETNACRLYRDWEDPDQTKRAWSMVMMYLMTDARFLYE